MVPKRGCDLQLSQLLAPYLQQLPIYSNSYHRAHGHDICGNGSLRSLTGGTAGYLALLL